MASPDYSIRPAPARIDLRGNEIQETIAEARETAAEATGAQRPLDLSLPKSERRGPVSSGTPSMGTFPDQNSRSWGEKAAAIAIAGGAAFVASAAVMAVRSKQNGTDFSLPGIKDGWTDHAASGKVRHTAMGAITCLAGMNRGMGWETSLGMAAFAGLGWELGEHPRDRKDVAWTALGGGLACAVAWNAGKAAEAAYDKTDNPVAKVALKAVATVSNPERRIFGVGVNVGVGVTPNGKPEARVGLAIPLSKLGF